MCDSIENGHTGKAKVKCPVCRCEEGWDKVQEALDTKLQKSELKINKGAGKRAIKEILKEAAQ